MCDKYIKLLFKVELIGDSKVSIEALYVSDHILNCQYAVMFSYGDLTIEKFSNFGIKKNRILIPYKILRTKKYLDVIDLKSDNLRYEYLKKLSVFFKKFSKSYVFDNMEYNTRFSYDLKMDKNYWILY